MASIGMQSILCGTSDKTKSSLKMKLGLVALIPALGRVKKD